MEINDIEKIIGYTFSRKNLLSIAFRRCTLTNNKCLANNQVMEFIGDKVIYQYINKEIAKIERKNYLKDSKALHDEAEYTRFVNYYTNKEYFNKRINEMDLAKYMMVSSDNEITERTKDDLFEAIVGSIWLDTKMSESKTFKVLKVLLKIDLNNNEAYKKTEKQELNEKK